MQSRKKQAKSGEMISESANSVSSPYVSISIYRTHYEVLLACRIKMAYRCMTLNKWRWKEYIEDLNRSGYKQVQEGGSGGDWWGGEETGPETLKEEVLAAITMMKNNKAEGIWQHTGGDIKRSGRESIERNVPAMPGYL